MNQHTLAQPNADLGEENRMDTQSHFQQHQKKTPTILVVDDEPGAVSGCRFLLESAGFQDVRGVMDAREVLPCLEKEPVDAILLDLAMPHIPGEKLLPQLVSQYPHIPVLVLTGANRVETAISCMKMGAFDYIVKPAEETRLCSSVWRALEINQVRSEYAAFRSKVLKDALQHPDVFEPILTKNARMFHLFQYVETIASTGQPVLITGETGAGKELFAQAHHALSRLEGPFLATSIGQLSEDEFADVLFGHIKGAFAGAETAREGLIAEAAGGTLLLDGIDELAPLGQIKLLRLLQQKEYFPVGADAAREVKAQIIATTTRDLTELCRQGTFRIDLFYRLQAQHIHVPPLRERPEDLPLLIEHFLEKAARTLKKPKPHVPIEIIDLLRAYHFPGNIRELETLLYDALAHHKDRTLSLHRVREYVRPKDKTDPAPSPEPTDVFSGLQKLPTLKEAPRYLILEALSRTNGNQAAAATLLGITPSGLSRAIKRNRIDLSRAK